MSRVHISHTKMKLLHWNSTSIHYWPLHHKSKKLFLVISFDMSNHLTHGLFSFCVPNIFLTIGPHSPRFSQRIWAFLLWFSGKLFFFLCPIIPHWSFLDVHHYPCSRGKWFFWFLHLQLPAKHFETYISSLVCFSTILNWVYIAFSLLPPGCFKETSTVTCPLVTHCLLSNLPPEFLNIVNGNLMGCSIHHLESSQASSSTITV